MGVPIIDLLETVFHPAKAPLPKVEATGTELKIGPDLLRKGQTMTFVVLADGASSHLKCENPLANVREKEVRYQARQEAAWWQTGMLKKVVTWAIIIFVVFYLATQPTSASKIIHHAYNGIHSAGISLAKFVNSL